jgi:hypothetical protein
MVCAPRSSARFRLLRVGLGDDFFEQVRDGGDIGGRRRVVRRVGRGQRQFGLSRVEVVEAGLTAREPVLAAFG